MKKQGELKDEYLTIEGVAELIHYSTKYMQNNWHKLLQGIKPLGIGKKILFPREAVIRKINERGI